MLFTFLFHIHFMYSRNAKVVLAFEDIDELNKVMSGIKNSSFKNITSKPVVSNDKIIFNVNDLENIPLNEKTLCLIFNNLDLLREKDKLKDVKIKDIVTNKNNRDLWNKLEFVEGVDKSGYFYKLQGSMPDDTEAFRGVSLKKDMFYHKNDISPKIIEENILNIKKIIFYLSILKKKELKDLLREKCELEILNSILFRNQYSYQENDNFNVCVCKDLLCTVCDGMYNISKDKLIM